MVEWSVQLQLFQMAEIFTNGTSNEQFSFKLTQQVLPSFTHSNPALSHPQDSLDYSLSRISIQHILQESDREEQQTHKQPENSSPSKNLSSLTKESSLKASSINTTQASIRTLSRLRALSMKGNTTAREASKHLSFRIFQFGEDKPVRGSQTSRKGQGWEERRKLSKSQKRENTPGMLTSRSSVHTTHKNPQKMLAYCDLSLSKLQQSIKIRQVYLKTDEQREKNYLKRIIQARLSSNHMIQSVPMPLITRWRPSNRFR